jgi:hypothetical protein
MDKLGIKATIYDLLGYILPGSLFLLWIVWAYHPYIPYFNSINLNFIIDGKVTVIIGFISIAYILGQLLSAIGAFVLEGPVKTAIGWLLGKIPEKIFQKLKKPFSFFNLSLTKNEHPESRDNIAFVQYKYPSVYDTAFVFLSIYDLSRNIIITIILCIMTYPSSISIKHGPSIIFYLSIAALIFLNNYLRFKQYFNVQIRAGINLSLTATISAQTESD